MFRIKRLVLAVRRFVNVIFSYDLRHWLEAETSHEVRLAVHFRSELICGEREERAVCGREECEATSFWQAAT